MMQTVRPLGDLLREWRQRRRMSQLDLACEAEISTRHLSFLETGRSQPSREMVLNLSERLDVPLRERNILLVSAGFAPLFPERPFDDPALLAARSAIDLILGGHEPFPALAIDRHWTILASNGAVASLLSGVDHTLLEPPVNALRLTLHPEGLAPRIANLTEWRAHLLARLRHQIDITADAVLGDLYDELVAFPHPNRPTPAVDPNALAVPFKLTVGETLLTFLSTTTVFGTPVDVTLAEIALEAFFPADPATAEFLRAGTSTSV